MRSSVTESESDPAHGVLARLLKQRRRLTPPTWMVVAGEAKNRGQKVHNLLAALDTLNSIDRRVEALVFADSDMLPARNWLAELVASLGDRQVGATTGYRWYLPSDQWRDPERGFASILLSVWNSTPWPCLASVPDSPGEARRRFSAKLSRGSESKNAGKER